MIAFGSLLKSLDAWFDADDGAGSEGPHRAREILCGFSRVEGCAPLLSKALFDDAWYAEQHPGRSGKDGGAAALKRYLGTGVGERHNPSPWFDEACYRENYPDVQAGIEAGRWSCGYQHYLTRGMLEGRDPSPVFSELAYLGTYDDVLEGVRSGGVPNGLLHAVTVGVAEQRRALPPLIRPLLNLPLERSIQRPADSHCFSEAFYCQHNQDVATDGAPSPGMRHWLSHGLMEDLRGDRHRPASFVEAVYLRRNPDIAHVVSTGQQPSGYHHFLMYGAAEGRPWSGDWNAAAERQVLERARTHRSAPPEGDGLPSISVLVPVYNTPRHVLLACIESVRAQSYPHWELCLADDGSFLPETTEVLSAAAADPRIRVVWAARNGGIAAASNLALAAGNAPFVALLDHDDLLAPDALLHVARAFMSSPDVDMVYTDEAKLTEDGVAFGLNAKPGWSPDLLLSTMHVGHLTAYRRTIVEAAGGFRSLFDGTQDYDLALRAAELVRRVLHVPMPLYFWRVSATSTAGSIDAKPGVLEVQRQALENALLRRGQRGAVRAGHSPGHWTVLLDVPEHTPLVSVVVPTAGRTAEIGGQTIDLVVNCLRSMVSMTGYPNVEYVIVHNDDLRPETLLGLAALRHVRLVAYRDAPFNLSDKINLGVREAAGEFVLLLNDDMQAASPGIVRAMLGRMYDGVGLVGGRLLFANGTLQHAGIVWTAEGPTHAMIGEHRLTAGPAERLRIAHDCFGVSGACMFFRREVFLEAGGFSPALPTNYNDVDLCIRIRAAGMRVLFNPDVTMFHFESLSKSGTHFWELQQLLLSYPGLSDPYWNANFSDASPYYELRDAGPPPLPSYRGWMVNRTQQRCAHMTDDASIRFSVFMSVYDTKLDQLEALAATVLRQTYPNWEWVIVDNGSSAPATLAWLERIEAHPRVRFVRLETNQGIMGGYGAAFRACEGDYVVPVDSDDLLTLDCLQALATAIAEGRQPDALYSDEDKANENGLTHSPFLKPDWDPLLFTNICYVCHVCAIKREVAVTVGAYADNAAAWCHDWDTFLRLVRAGARIVHVPELLYSWRIHMGSTASIETGMKPQTLTSQRHVLSQHLRLTGLDRNFQLVQNELFPHDGIWRLKPKAGAGPRTAILLTVTGDLARAGALLLDLARGMPKDALLLLVGGTESSHRGLDRLPPELLTVLGRKATSRLRNELELEAALELCRTEGYDAAAVVDAGVGRLNAAWFREGASMFATSPEVGAVGGQVALPNGRVLWRGGFLGFGGMAGSPDYGRAVTESGYHGMAWCQRHCDSVPSVCFFARLDVLTAAAKQMGSGPLSLRSLAGHVADAAQRLGRTVVYTPFVQATLEREAPVAPILPPAGAEVARPGICAPQAFGHELRTSYALVHGAG